jgi:peptide/nickel transport system substrate-binding protein
VLQTQYKAIGIELAIRNEPARLMFDETLRKRSYRGAAMFMSDPPMDYVPIYAFHSDRIPRAENNWTGQNYMGLRNPAMDSALDAAWTELDPVKRKVLSKRILGIAAEEVPEVNPFFDAQTMVTPKWLTGVAQPTRFGSPTQWIEEWQPL